MKIETICENRIFARAYHKGKKHAGKYSVLYVLPSSGKSVRIGLTVSSKRGNAVTRSRIKRVLRHAYYSVVRELGSPVGCDIVIVARDACAFAKSTEVAFDMKSGLIRLGIVKDKPDNE